VAISTQVFADKPSVSVAVMALGVVTVAPLIVATEWGKMATAPTAPSLLKRREQVMAQRAVPHQRRASWLRNPVAFGWTGSSPDQ